MPSTRAVGEAVSVNSVAVYTTADTSSVVSTATSFADVSATSSTATFFDDSATSSLISEPSAVSTSVVAAAGVG